MKSMTATIIHPNTHDAGFVRAAETASLPPDTPLEPSGLLGPVRLLVTAL